MEKLLFSLAISFVIWLIIKIASAKRTEKLDTTVLPVNLVLEYVKDIKEIRAAGGGYQAQKECLTLRGVDELIAENIILLIEKGEL